MAIFVQQMQQLRIKGNSAAEAMSSKLASNPLTLGICFVASLCALLPLDISQLSFAILGAILYALLQKSEISPQNKKKYPLVATKLTHDRSNYAHVLKAKGNSHRPIHNLRPFSQAAKIQNADTRQASVQPILAPTFQSKDWDGEVRELLAEISPTAAVQEVVHDLALMIQRIIRQVIPEVEVTGFANGNITIGKAFGVAVPEVDITATVHPQIIYARLQGRRARSDEIDVHKVQKAAIRAFTDRLISTGGFKFRRSAFRGHEPKVTLLVPKTLGLIGDSIPIDFSVNSVTPLYNAALLTKCGQIDPRARYLILLVRRWAKDRGICHNGKGHLSPFMWSLLSIYFLQVGVNEEGPLLPPVGQFMLPSGLGVYPCAVSNAQDNAPKSTWSPTSMGTRKSVGELFKDFVSFFGTQFNCQREAVSIRLGQRAPPSSDLPLHIIVAGDSSATQLGVSIESPLHTTHNLGDCMTAFSLARFQEEFRRADTLCANCASLSELLEPWAPSGEPNCDIEAQGNGIVEPVPANDSGPP